MNTKITLIIGVSVLSAVITANSAVINYAGVTTNTSITAIPWVTGSTMWGEIETGVAKGTSQVGFSSLDGLDPSKLEWQFGGLELEIGTAVSPGPASAGFEKYIDQGSATSLQFSYDGVLWASATINEFEVNVDDVNDFNAAGVGTATFVSFEPAGSNFFSNVMALTGGTGDVTITADSFTAVSPSTFTSIGTLTAIPEPSSAIFMAIGCGLLLYFRRRR